MRRERQQLADREIEAGGLRLQRGGALAQRGRDRGVLGANRLGLGGGERDAAGGLESARDVREQRLAILVDIVDHRQGLAEPDRGHALADHVERRALLAHHRDAFAAAQRLGDQVDDDLALAGAGRSVDHRRAMTAGLGDDRALRWIGGDHRRPVSAGRRGSDGERLRETGGEERAGRGEQHADVGVGASQVLQEPIVVLQQIRARLREHPHDRDLLEGQAGGERRLVEIDEGLQRRGAVGRDQADLGEARAHGFGAAPSVTRERFEFVGQLIGVREAALVEDEPDERLVRDRKLVAARLEAIAARPRAIARELHRVQHQRRAHQVALDDPGEERIADVEIARAGLFRALRVFARQREQLRRYQRGGAMAAGVGGVDDPHALAGADLGHHALGHADRDALEGHQIERASAAQAAQAHRRTAAVARHQLLTQSAQRGRQGDARGRHRRRGRADRRGSRRAQRDAIVEARLEQRRQAEHALAGECSIEAADQLVGALLGAHQAEQAAQRDRAGASTDDAGEERSQGVIDVGPPCGQGLLRRRDVGQVDVDALAAQHRRQRPREVRADAEHAPDLEDQADLGGLDLAVGEEHFEQQIEQRRPELVTAGGEDRRRLEKTRARDLRLEVGLPVRDLGLEHAFDQDQLVLGQLAVGLGHEHRRGERALEKLARHLAGLDRIVDRDDARAQTARDDRVDVGQLAGARTAPGQRVVGAGLAEQPGRVHPQPMLGVRLFPGDRTGAEVLLDQILALREIRIGVVGQLADRQARHGHQHQPQERAQVLARQERAAIGGQLARHAQARQRGIEGAVVDESSRDPRRRLVWAGRAVSEVVAEFVTEQREQRAGIEPRQQRAVDLQQDRLGDHVHRRVLGTAPLVQLERAGDAEHLLRMMRHSMGVGGHPFTEPQALRHQATPLVLAVGRAQATRDLGEQRVALDGRGDRALVRDADGLDVEPGEPRRWCGGRRRHR